MLGLYLSIYFIHISNYTSIYLYFYLHICIYNFFISIYLSIHLSIHLCIYPSIYLSIHLSIYLFIYPSIYLSITTKYLSLFYRLYLSLLHFKIFLRKHNFNYILTSFILNYIKQNWFLCTKKALIRTFHTSFLHNNLCEFTSLEHYLLCTQKPGLNIRFKEFWYTKIYIITFSGVLINVEISIFFKF